MATISVAPSPAPVIAAAAAASAAAAAPDTPASRSPTADSPPARPFDEALKQELAKPDTSRPQGEKPETAARDSAKPKAAKSDVAKPGAAKPEAKKSATAPAAADPALPEWAALLENTGLAKADPATASAEITEGKELIERAVLPPAEVTEAMALPLAALVTPAAPAPVESALVAPAFVAPAVVAPQLGAQAAATATVIEIDTVTAAAAAAADVAAAPHAPRAGRKAEVAEELQAALHGAKADATPEYRLAAAAAERPLTVEGAATSSHPAASLDGITSAALAPRWIAAHSMRVDGASPGQPATARIDTPIGAHGWGEAFQQKIVWLVDRQQQSAELHVNPPHLGPVDVVLTFTDDSAQIAFTSPHAAVREAIEATLGDLRTALSDKGLTLGEARVGADSNQAREQLHAEARQSARGNRAAGVSDIAIDAPAPHIIQRGLVDLFA
jgi:flagellar hook-length control protein FliK